MPTTNIIGYLWHNRQDLNLDGLPDVLDMVADLQRLGMTCVRVETISVLGQPATASVQLVMLPDEDWAKLVENALINASIENTIHMFHEERG